mmetsp:Transcript_15651/g.34511  ORF Transcript_15651/g.34511 Transcript_15651/m.34511 type:complete len:222 (-) Transcript_15651:549-1214(-)
MQHPNRHAPADHAKWVIQLISQLLVHCCRDKLICQPFKRGVLVHQSQQPECLHGAANPRQLRQPLELHFCVESPCCVLLGQSPPLAGGLRAIVHNIIAANAYRALDVEQLPADIDFEMQNKSVLDVQKPALCCVRMHQLQHSKQSQGRRHGHEVGFFVTGLQSKRDTNKLWLFLSYHGSVTCRRQVRSNDAIRHWVIKRAGGSSICRSEESCELASQGSTH